MLARGIRERYDVAVAQYIPLGVPYPRGMRLQPSLKWLIDRRARLSGEIIRIEKTLPRTRIELSKTIARVERRVDQLTVRLNQLKEQRGDLDEQLLHLEALRSSLNAIDKSLAQHAIKIDPERIKPIRSQIAVRFLGHGEMTRQIYVCLKNAYPDPRTSIEVTAFILASTQLELNTHEVLALREQVRTRLGALTRQNKIARLHEAKTHEEGRWTLLPSAPPR